MSALRRRDRCARGVRRMASFCVLAGGVCLAGCASTRSERTAHESGHDAALANLPMARVQVIGSHNSYKRAMQPELRALLRPFYGGVDGVNYSHISMTDQLNLGLRNLEIDVYHDPVGGTYADPLGERLLRQSGKTPWAREDALALRTPGFKVMHDCDFDFRSCHLALEGCLEEIRRWSDAHPGHVPVVITMNTKQGEATVPGAAKPARFDGEAMRGLDRIIVEVLGRERLLTPDDVRGASRTLREAVVTRGWPTVGEAAGRCIVVLDEGGETRDRYLAQFPGLRGAALFVDADPAGPEAAIFVINDPVQDEEKIRALVKQGFLVRTRADADTKEARANDLSRFEAAKRSGAQIITTDYYIPDRAIDDRYMVRFEDGACVRVKGAEGEGGR